MEAAADLRKKGDELEEIIKGLRKDAQKQTADGAKLNRVRASHQAAMESLQGKISDLVLAASMEQVMTHACFCCGQAAALWTMRPGSSSTVCCNPNQHLQLAAAGNHLGQLQLLYESTDHEFFELQPGFATHDTMACCIVAGLLCRSAAVVLWTLEQTLKGPAALQKYCMTNGRAMTCEPGELSACAQARDLVQASTVSIDNIDQTGLVKLAMPCTRHAAVFEGHSIC